MVSSPRFDRFNHSRRRPLNRSNPEQALSRAIANVLAGKPVRSSGDRSRKSRRIDVGQVLESRLLLSSVTINLASWAGTNFLLEATGNSNNATWTLKDRDTNIELTSASINNSTTSVTINGYAQGDNIYITGASVFGTDGNGAVTTNLPAPLSFVGNAGVDVVTFSGDTAVTGDLSIDAETISVNSSIQIDSTTVVSLSAAATTGTQSNTGASPSISGTNAATVTVSGKVTAPAINITAATSGSVTTKSDYGLLLATNTWTDSATVTIGSAATLKSPGDITLSASRGTTYKTEARSAFNDISGGTTITIGGASATTVINAGGALSITAIDNLRAEALSPDQTYDLSTIVYPASIDAAVARNRLTGDTKIAVTSAAITQSGTSKSAVLEASRKAIVIAEAKSTSLAGAMPNGSSLSLSGTYASNILSGNVQTTLSGGSLTAQSASVSANDDAIAVVKADLSAKTTT